MRFFTFIIISERFQTIYFQLIIIIRSHRGEIDYEIKYIRIYNTIKYLQFVMITTLTFRYTILITYNHNNNNIIQ